MPRYRFEFSDEPAGDPIFADFENDEAAEAEARRTLAEGILDETIAQPDAPAVKVYNEAGQLVATIGVFNEPG